MTNSKKKRPAASPLVVEPRKRRVPVGLIVVVGVVLLAIVAAVGVDYWRKHSSVEVTSTGRTEPAVLTGPGTNGEGVKVGKDSATTNVDLFLDFRCPHCAEFEKETGPVLDQLVEDGTITLTYWPLKFVNPGASPRLANAFAAAAASGKALSYADEIYADFTKAWTEDQLIELGKKLGIDDAKFEDAIRNDSYAGWLESINKTSGERKVEGTPTVFVNDKMLQGDQLTVDGLKAAISGIS